MYDQLGGGFHRYSVDDVWLVPHFEKMLYDNAQLATVYLQAYQATGDGFYRRICTETLDYVLREMTAPEGGFYSAQDADSEGEEGKFFLWTPAEVAGLLGEEDARLFGAYFDVLPGGNFEGRSILHTPHPVEAVARAAGVPETRLEEAIARGRRLLFAARSERVPPGRDDKVLTAWNGLALRALARAGAALGREDYLSAARRNAAFVLEHLRAPGAGWRLLRSYKDGQARFNAYLEDYAFYADGLLALYEATFDPRWLGGAGPGGDDQRPVRRRRGRRFLRHQRRPRGPADPAEGSLRQRHSGGQLGGGGGAAAPGRAQRRRRRPGARRALPLRPHRGDGAAPRRLRAAALRSRLRRRPG